MERSDPFSTNSDRASFEIPERLQELKEILLDDEIPVHGDSDANSSHEAFQEPKKKEVKIWVCMMFMLISLMTEIARPVTGPRLQGPHVEDEMAKPHLEL